MDSIKVLHYTYRQIFHRWNGFAVLKGRYLIVRMKALSYQRVTRAVEDGGSIRCA